MAAPAPKALFSEYRDKIDESGLALSMAVDPLKINAAFPAGWQALPLQKSSLYTHQQWRSPSKRTGVGVTYVRMPIPLSTKTLVWFAMNEAGKKTNNGKIIRQWHDELGREWFEAENEKYHMTGYVMTRGFDAWINYCGYRVQEPMEPLEKYHMTGYVMTRGFDAWINYCGYRVQEPMEPLEIQLGNRSLETVMPLSVLGRQQIQSATAE
jgi:hypothetical protein